MKKLDLSVIVLAGNEEIHMKRCQELIIKYVKEMYNIDIKGVTSKNGGAIYRIYNSIKRPLFIQENSYPNNIEGAILYRERRVAA